MDILNAIAKSFYKIITLNSKTGEITFLKTNIDEDKKFKNIKDYISNLRDNKTISSYDFESFAKKLDNDILNKTPTVDSYDFKVRKNTTKDYSWMDVSIIVPDNYSNENPNILLCFREERKEVSFLYDMGQILLDTYVKVDKVNLTKGTFIKMEGMDERKRIVNREQNFEDSFKNILSTDLVYKDDVERFKKMINIDTIKKAFSSGQDIYSLRYRRNFNGLYRWVSLDLTKSYEYSDTNQVLILRVRDIHDNYVVEAERNELLQKQLYTDSLTGLKNKDALALLCNDFILSESCGKEPVAAIFADLNGLKAVNDLNGHDAGDLYLKQFSQLLVKCFPGCNLYRRSGDEFIVIIVGHSKENCERMVERFKKMVESFARPIASIGYKYDDNPVSITPIIKDAESLMYDEKQRYHALYPEFVRSYEIEKNGAPRRK